MIVQAQTINLYEANHAAQGSGWNSLYKAGGAAALLTVLFFPMQILGFLISPPPETVTGWFDLFQSSKLIGLLNLDLLLMVDQVLAILIFLALYVALRRANESIMAIGSILGLVSAVLFIASNPAFAMLSLSGRYATAMGAERTALLAAGQTLIAAWQGSAFQASYLLGSIAPILISAVMLRSKLFSKTTAYLGILANIVALGLYVPKIGVYISVFSVVLLWVWYILIARGFFQLGRSVQFDAEDLG